MADNDDRILADHHLRFYGASGESPLSFRRRFDIIADVRGWNAERKKANLILSFRDDALQWFADTEEALAAAGPITYDSLVQALIHRFEVPNADYFARMELDNIQQLPGERVSSYVARVQALGSPAFPELDFASRNKYLVPPFIRGLLREDIKQKVLAAQPPTLPVAFRLAQTFEATLGALGKKSDLVPAAQLPHANTVAPPPQHHQPGRIGSNPAYAAIDQPTYQRGIVQGRPQMNRYTPDGRPICNFCGEIGHMYRECDKRLMQQQRQGRPRGPNGTRRPSWGRTSGGQRQGGPQQREPHSPTSAN